MRVINRLKEVSSIHWHGLLLPPEMDGVPGVSFAGMKPGATFTYRFPIKQYGTYWYHSHAGMQEQEGVYAPMILDPAQPEKAELLQHLHRTGSAACPQNCILLLNKPDQDDIPERLCRCDDCEESQPREVHDTGHDCKGVSDDGYPTQ